MSVTSLSFIIFIGVLIAVYYIFPHKIQWIILLIFSIFFYISFGLKSAGYVLLTASSIYLATRWMQSISDNQRKYLKDNKATITKEEKKTYKEKNKKKRKCIMIGALFINIGLLAVFKYFHFALAQVNGVIAFAGGRQIEDVYRFIIPLGISFYTFQAVGYLVDVYFEYYPAEKNYFKVLLFVSFFPQMTQGPISDFEQLSKELFTEHVFSLNNYSWGFQRMIWGFFKKMLVADTLAPMVHDVFSNYSNYTGIATLLGAFMYSIQIYADFSGYMDIMCGLCEILGIHLTENFERPYFSRSIAEYWRRWHISLGAWFKKYIYYTIGMSSWSRKLAVNAKRKFGKHLGNTIPATIALLVVWSATGLWHGASWAYIVWGLVNGMFIIISLWMEPVYDNWKNLLGINESNKMWVIFQVIRTFVLVTFIKVLPEVGTLSQGIGLWRRVLTDWSIPKNITDILPFLGYQIGFTEALKYLWLVLGIVMMFVFSLIQIHSPVRVYYNRLPMIFRTMIMACIILILIVFGVPNTWGAGGFLYANF